MSNVTKEFLTVEEMATALSVSEQTIRVEIRRGSLRAIRIGRGDQRKTYRVKRADFDEYIEKRFQEQKDG